MRTRTDIQLYTWAKNTLEKAGLISKGKPGSGDLRLRREHRPVEGMMFHQDGVQLISGFGDQST
jgi:hypothetical protein